MSLRVRLYNLEPPEGPQAPWPQDCIEELKDLKRAKMDLLMYTYDVDLGNVALFDDNLANVNKLLIDDGLASEGVSQENLPQIHLPEVLNWKLEEYKKCLEERFF